MLPGINLCILHPPTYSISCHDGTRVGAAARTTSYPTSRAPLPAAAGSTSRITSAPARGGAASAPAASATRRPATAAVDGGSDSLNIDLDLSGDLDISFSDDGHTSGTARGVTNRPGAATSAAGKGGNPGGPRAAFTSATDLTPARPGTRGKQGQLGGGGGGSGALSGGMAGSNTTAASRASTTTAGGSGGIAARSAAATGRAASSGAGIATRKPARATEDLSLSMSDISGDIVLGGSPSSQSLEIEFSDEEGIARTRKQGGTTKGAGGGGGRTGEMQRPAMFTITIRVCHSGLGCALRRLCTVSPSRPW
jgi:hypothetical protein